MTDYENMTDREIDALVAEKVMGLNVTSKESYNWVNEFGSRMIEYIPHYSTSIAAAWEIVEKYSTWPWCFTRSGETFKFDLGYEGHRYYAISDTAPRAICLAALRAVEGK